MNWVSAYSEPLVQAMSVPIRIIAQYASAPSLQILQVILLISFLERKPSKFYRIHLTARKEDLNQRGLSRFFYFDGKLKVQELLTNKECFKAQKLFHMDHGLLENTKHTLLTLFCQEDVATEPSEFKTSLKNCFRGQKHPCRKKQDQISNRDKELGQMTRPLIPFCPLVSERTEKWDRCLKTYIYYS